MRTGAKVPPDPHDNNCTRLALALKQRRIRFGTELDMQADVRRHLVSLSGHFGPPQAEHIFDAKNRVDFWLPTVRIAVECKVQGSVSSVAEQLQRYAQLDGVEGLVLVTRCRAHRFFPIELCGKPLQVVWAAGKL